MSCGKYFSSLQVGTIAKRPPGKLPRLCGCLGLTGEKWFWGPIGQGKFI